MSLHDLVLMVKQLILLRAGDIAGLKRKQRPILSGTAATCAGVTSCARSSAPSCAVRLRTVTPVARIAILVDALTHLDAWAARFWSASVPAACADSL